MYFVYRRTRIDAHTEHLERVFKSRSYFEAKDWAQAQNSKAPNGIRYTVEIY